MTVAELIKKLLDVSEGNTNRNVKFFVEVSEDIVKECANDETCFEDWTSDFEIEEDKPYLWDTEKRNAPIKIITKWD